ncbi:MAG: class I SAM-dependent methyltransferase [Desulfurivibrionaceae bacterium]|jgi:ubiquinone/menaquinone biosynthesis C-methylase UbiE
MDIENANKDDRVVRGFGEEWSRFSQACLSDEERGRIFEDYFALFPWDKLPFDSKGADIGCGSGRWAAVVAPRVGHLVCVDASADALEVARHNLEYQQNVEFQIADVGRLPFAEGELDFAYSLGVLHHVPDTEGAIVQISKCLKPGGLFLVYLYYAFDNRPFWFRFLWRFSDLLRQVLCRMPSRLRFLLCDAIAILIYWPLACVAAMLERLGLALEHFPLSYYRDKSFYVMRTDALDRFGTRLEKRYSRRQISAMLESAGFSDVKFSEVAPFWCAIGIRKTKAE